jgi:hypothetical protein
MKTIEIPVDRFEVVSATPGYIEVECIAALGARPKRAK